MATLARSQSVIEATLEAAESLDSYLRVFEGRKLPEVAAPVTLLQPSSPDPPALPAISTLPPRVVARRLRPAATMVDMAPLDEPLVLGQPDWLFNELTVAGPAHALAALRSAARGTGVIPWERDYDVLEEDLFLLLVQQRDRETSLGSTSAHALARRIRTLAEHAEQGAWQNRCSVQLVPFDLHALLPVPADVLGLGPDHPQTRRWLWTRWGTTRPLRRVDEPLAMSMTASRKPIEGDRWRVDFWSADWSPWLALRTLAAEWPQLQFRLRPVYDLV